MASERHELVATLGERAADNKDSNLINCVVDIVQVGPKQSEAWVVKRPGLKAYDDLSAATTDTGRGVFNWDGRVYSVIGDELFEDETDRGQLLSSSGRCYFDIMDGSIDTTDEGSEEIAGPFLIIQDGGTVYAVDDEGVMYSYGQTVGAEVDVETIPSTMLPGVVVLDHYIFVASNGDTSGSTNINEIHNSDVGSISEWAGNFIVGELRADKGVAIARYYNYLISFNEKTTEFFFDNANAVGTPLNRYDGVLLLEGMPTGAGNTAVNVDNRMVWVAQSSTQGRYVNMLDKGFTSKRISTTAIDEALEAEDTNISNAYAYHIRIAGNNLYVLTLPTTTAKTFVYDLDVGLWYTWTSDVSDTETYFTAMDSTEKGGKIILMDENNGKLFELDTETYQDNSGAAAETIKVEIHTKRFDLGVQLNKFCHRLYPVSDFYTGTADLLVSWSDDDYTTFVSNRTLDLSNSSSFLTRLGFFRRRSYRLQYQSNTALRIMALDVDMSHGYFAR